MGEKTGLGFDFKLIAWCNRYLIMPLSDNNPTWTSLEVVKLVVSAITPILVIFIGLLIDKRLKKLDHKEWRNQKLIEKRLSIYDDITPILNDLLCYYTYVGNWKEFTPDQIVQMKRDIDKKIYLASPLFCREFFTACTDYINLCYKAFTGWGRDAQLRTKFLRRQEAFGAKWDKSWEAIFCTDGCPEPQQIREGYMHIMTIFAQEIGLQDQTTIVTGSMPVNIR